MTRPYADALREAATRLQGWPDLPFFTDGSFETVLTTLAVEPGPVFPPPTQVFAALDRTPPDAVRAVILGQDPYPTAGHANGLAFSAAPDVTPLPRSLGNIYKELDSDLGTRPATADLGGWADRGVLLLNRTLTVREGEAGSHARIGWSALIDQIVARIAERDRIVWILWGKHAQGIRPLIEAGQGTDPLVLESAHPSPLSARRGFFGSRPFGAAEAHAGAALFRE